MLSYTKQSCGLARSGDLHTLTHSERAESVSCFLCVPAVETVLGLDVSDPCKNQGSEIRPPQFAITGFLDQGGSYLPYQSLAFEESLESPGRGATALGVSAVCPQD